MKLHLLIALAILPCLSLNAQAHGYRHHYRHHHGPRFGHHHWGRHRWSHPFYSHRRHAEATETTELSKTAPHDHTPSVPEGRGAIYAMVTRSAIEHGLPPSLAHGIVRVESGYNCAAYHSGATGIMQVKAATARSVGVSGGLRSCANGLEAGMRYLRQAYDIAHGNQAVAATLYNRGLGARPARSGYSRSVMRMSAL